MKNLKVYDNLKTKAGTVALSLMLGTTSLGITGCELNDENFESHPLYIVEKADKQLHFEEKHNYIKKLAKSGDHIYVDSFKTANCKYYVDLGILDEDIKSYNRGQAEEKTEKSIIDEGYEYNKDLKNDGYYKKDFLYQVRHMNFSTSYDSIQVNKGLIDQEEFLSKCAIVIPDSYKYLLENEAVYKTIGGNFKGTLSYTELYSISGTRYFVYETSISAKKDIIVPFSFARDYINEYGIQKRIKKGDKITYKALYEIKPDNKLNLIADQQEGIGSNCENVTEKVKNNFNKIYRPIAEINNDDRSNEYNNTDEMYQDIYKATIRKRTNK